MSARDATAAVVADLAAARGRAARISLDDKGRLVLPAIPAPDDVAAQLSWLTASLALDPRHGVVRVERQGVRGPDGHVVVFRAEAQPLRFEPATRINTPARLVETLSWSGIPTDDEVPPYRTRDCQQIAHVVRMLCGLAETMTDEQETASIVGAYLQTATAQIEHTTYGTQPQRYEAASALSPETDANGRPLDRRYLVDANTGEFVIRVSDLAETARRIVGGSIAHGWLDGRLDGLGWQRVRLSGHAVPGRAGRRGPHLRVDVYRGHLPAGDDEGVST